MFSENIYYAADVVLLVSLSLLMLHPGAFVPHIKTFVSGAEGALKRLAVTICEDSHTEDDVAILSLLVGILSLQNISS